MFNSNTMQYYPIFLVMGVSAGLSVYIRGMTSNNVQMQGYGAFGIFFTIILGILILAIALIDVGTDVGDEK
jgi:hypothetical protein